MNSFKTSDGKKIAYFVDDFSDPWRDDLPVIMIHAAMGHSGRFFAMVPPIAREFRTIRMDMRGHGASEVPPQDEALTMERLVRDVVELMDHLSIPKAHFIGNSAGGYLSQHMAMDAPERVASLSIFGSTPGLKRSQARTWLPRVAKEGLRNFLAATISDRFPLDRTDPRHIEWFLDEAAKNDTAFIGKFVGLMSELDWTDELVRIKCPTLIVAAGAETVGGTAHYDEMKANIPGSVLKFYEGLPHNICDSVPDRCAKDAIDFVRSHFPKD